MTNETALQKRIQDAVLRKYPDAWVMKVHGSPYQMAGVPDLLVVVDGLLVALEVKHQRPGESEQHARDRTTEQQRIQIQRLREAGAAADTVLTPDEALGLIRVSLEP